MGNNIAARRAAKAQRRKTIVADKRKADLQANSLAAQVRLAAQLPLQFCLLSNSLFSLGLGTLYVARGASRHRFWLASFLLDRDCLGVKDVFLREFDGAEFNTFLTTRASGVASVEPSYARKLLRDLVSWSASAGYGPHEDFAVIERIFGSVRAEDCTEAFDFGQDGTPVLIPGPFDSLDMLRQRRLDAPAEPAELEGVAEEA